MLRTINREQKRGFSTSFGVTIKERTFAAQHTRYQFNGKEYDNETETSDFGARNLDGDLGIWGSVDPQFSRQPGWSTYKAFLDNPIIYQDPNGETEYYNNKGRWIGSDGIPNGENKLVLVKSTSKLVKNATKNNQYIGLNENVYFGIVDVESTTVINAMENAIKRSNNPTSDDKTGKFHEEGFLVGKYSDGSEGILDAPPGEKGLPESGKMAQIDFNSTFEKANKIGLTVEKDVHIHPKGKTLSYDVMRNEFTKKRFSQTPSPDDINGQSAYEKKGINYSIVVGAKDKSVNYYNTKGQGQTNLRSLKRANKSISKKQSSGTPRFR